MKVFPKLKMNKEFKEPFWRWLNFAQRYTFIDYISRIILVLYSHRTTAPRIIITVAASLSLVFGMYWPSCDCFLFASDVRNQNFITRKWNMRLKLCLVSTAGQGLGWKFVCNPSPLVLLNHHLSWSHHFLVSNDSLRIFHCFLPFF